MNQQQRIATWDEVEAMGIDKGIDKGIVIGIDRGRRSQLLEMAQRYGAPQKLMLEWQSIESVDLLSEAVYAWMDSRR